ncbi:MAG: hypothetical protein N3A01_07670 [Bacteroidales bacterium]|nr:hypothetical protein [Bacteroidales bacterium]
MMKHLIFTLLYVYMTTFSQIALLNNKNFLKYADEYNIYYKDSYKLNKHTFVNMHNESLINNGWYNLTNDSNYFLFLNPFLTIDYCSDNSFINNTGFHYKAGKSNKYGISGTVSTFLIKPTKFQTKLIDSTNILPYTGIFSSYKNNLLYSINPEFTVYFKLYPFLHIEGGYGHQFVGDGYRSLFLSNQGCLYPYIKGTTKTWRIEYSILYSFFNEPKFKFFNEKFSKKYSTCHYVNFELTKHLNLNAFETVIWQPIDSIGKRGIEINYINPFIFFRPVEWALGSPDNVLLGFGLTHKFFKASYLYLQILVDEFYLKEFKTKKGWWGNKYAFQFGYKCYNTFNIDNFYTLVETNVCMPFTYSHSTYLKNWGNNHYPLAHPMGSNFLEVILVLQYPFSNFIFTTFSFLQYQGKTDSINRGDNIYVSYNYKRNDYGNFLLSGNLQKNIYLYFDIYYLLSKKYLVYLFAGTNATINNKNFFIYCGISKGQRLTFFRNNL